MRRLALILLVVLAGAWGTARACPNCAEAMPGSRSSDPASAASANAPSGLADGFYWSILFMLAVPYALAGAGGYALYRALRKRSATLSEAPQP